MSVATPPASANYTKVDQTAAAAAGADAAAACTDLLTIHQTLGLLSNSFIEISLYIYNGETEREKDTTKNVPCRKRVQNSDVTAI